MIDCFDVRIGDRTTRFSSRRVCLGFKAVCAEYETSPKSISFAPKTRFVFLFYRVSFFLFLFSLFFALSSHVCFSKPHRFDEEDRNSEAGFGHRSHHHRHYLTFLSALVSTVSNLLGFSMLSRLGAFNINGMYLLKFSVFFTF